MAITISGINNNDRIVATDGTIDALSGFNVVGVMTAASFSGDLVGNVTGNVTGNINNSTLLLQTSGTERIRITGNNEIGIAGANYGSAGQVLTSGGSGSAVSWTTLTSGVTSDSEENTIGGTGAGDNLDSDTYRNTLFGYQAGEQINSGDDNTLVGWKAADKLTSGYKNCAFGSEALEYLTSGYDNVAMGWEAGRSCNGNGNTMIGNMAGRTMSGSDNIAIGDHAYSNGGGTRSIGIGGESVWLGGTDVIGIGKYTMARGGSQIGGIGIGYYAGRNNAGDHNVYLGYEAGYGTGSSPYAIGNYNISLGYRSLYSVTSASSNVAIGASAGDVLTTGGNNIILGDGADASSATVSNEVTIGNSSINHVRIPGIGVSFSEGGAVISGIVTATNFVKADGSAVGGLSSDAQSNTVGGSGAGDSFSGTDAENNTLIGKNAGTSISSGDKNTVVGSLAGDALNTGSENTFVGYQAGSGDTNQTANTAVGVFALQSAGGSNNTAIGYRAGTSTGGSANQNVAIGYWALPYVSGGSNFAVGTFAMGGRTTSGSYNLALGSMSGYYLGGGQKNIFIGSNSGYEINGGSNNVCLGHDAGRHIDEGVSGNTLLGYRAGYNVDGNNNTIIGSMEFASNTTVNGQISIGAGTTERFRITPDGVIETGTAIGDSAYDGNQRLRVGRTGDCSISIRANGSTTAATGLDFGDDDDDRAGRILYVHNGNYMSFHTNGAGTGSANEQLRITSDGVVIINQTSASGTKLAIQSTASSGSGTATGIRVGNNIGVLSQYPANIEVRTTGVATYNAIRTDAGDGNGGFTCGVESYNGFLDLTTGGSNDIKVKLRSNGVSYLNGGKVVIGSAETSTGLLLLDKNLSASSDVSDKNNYHLVIRSQTNENPSKIGIAFANTTDDIHVGAAIIHERESTDSIGSLLFYTSPSSGTLTEKMKIDRHGRITKPLNPAFKSNSTGSYGGVGSLTTTVANVGILQASEAYDRGDNYSTSTYLFTCPVDGIYMVDVFVSLGNVGTSRHIFVIAYTNGGGSTPLQNYFECIDGNTSSYANYSYCQPWYFTAGTTIGVGKNNHSGSNNNYQMQWGVHLIA